MSELKDSAQLLKEYSREEVAKHNTAESLWLIVDSHVYDVTGFLNDHPGGQKPFLNWAGLR